MINTTEDSTVLLISVKNTFIINTKHKLTLMPLNDGFSVLLHRIPIKN